MKRIFSIITSFAMIISIVMSSAAAVQVGNLKIDYPDLLLADAGKTYQLDIPFGGQGIDSVSISNNGVTATIINVKWQAYPKKCTATIRLQVPKTGQFTLWLNNNAKGRIGKKIFAVVVKNQTSKVVDQEYWVAHANGVNVRSLPSSTSTVKATLPKGKKINVKFIQDGWGYVSAYSGFISLKYCSSSSSGGETTSGYDRQAAIRFAEEHAYTNSSWLCSEYVSRCLRAGNLPIDIEPGVGGLFRALDSMKGVKKYTLSVERNGKILPQKNGGKISTGDVIILYCNGCTDGRPYIHAVLVGSTPNSGIKVYAHNRAYCNQVYYGFNNCGYCGSKNVTAYGFHFT